MKYIFSIEIKTIEENKRIFATPLLRKLSDGWHELSLEDKKNIFPEAKKSYSAELVFPEDSDILKKLDKLFYSYQLVAMEVPDDQFIARTAPKKNEPVYYIPISNNRIHKGLYTPIAAENVFFGIPITEETSLDSEFGATGINPNKKSNTVVLFSAPDKIRGPYRVYDIRPLQRDGDCSFRIENGTLFPVNFNGYRLLSIKLGATIFNKGVTYYLALPPLRTAPAPVQTAPKHSVSQEAELKNRALETYKILENNLAQHNPSTESIRKEILEIKKELEATLSKINRLLATDSLPAAPVPKKGKQDGKKRAELFEYASQLKNSNNASEIYELFVLYVIRSEMENYGFAAVDEYKFTYALVPNPKLKVNNTYCYKKDNTEAILYFQPVIDQKPENVENGLDIYRRREDKDKDEDKYTPDFVLKITRDGASEYLIMDAKYKSFKNTIKDIETLIFKYCHSLAVANPIDSISGMVLIYGKPQKKEKPRFQFEDMSFNSQDLFVYLNPLAEDGVPSHYTLKSFLKPFIIKEG